MMFEVNLIRDRVMAPHRRRLLFWGMMLYLGLCSILLVAVIFTDTYRVLDAVANNREASAIEAAFKEAYHQDEDLITYARTLKEQLEEDRNRVDTVHKLVEQRANLTRILIGLSVPMPRNFTIDNFALDQRNGRLSFKLTVPEESAREASNLVASWNASPDLGREAGGFRTVARNQTSRDGISYLELQVEGSLQGKGS